MCLPFSVSVCGQSQEIRLNWVNMAWAWLLFHSNCCQINCYLVSVAKIVIYPSPLLIFYCPGCVEFKQTCALIAGLLIYNMGFIHLPIITLCTQCLVITINGISCLQMLSTLFHSQTSICLEKHHNVSFKSNLIILMTYFSVEQLSK